MQVVDIVLGVTSFFTIALGGLCVGMLLGLVTALITRFTKEVRQGVDNIYISTTISTQVRVVEPLAILSLAYTAYMTAELLTWSGIISMIGTWLSS